MILECSNCFNQFNPEASTALKSKNLYCSSECENEDTARINLGNTEIAALLEENPLALGHTAPATQPLENKFSSLGTLNFETMKDILRPVSPAILKDIETEQE